MPAIDEHIKRWLEQAERSGELRDNPYIGKPLRLEDGYEATPAELRMSYRILRNAGYLPREVELVNHLCELEQRLRDCGDEEARPRMRRRVAELRTQLALMSERLGRGRR